MTVLPHDTALHYEAEIKGLREVLIHRAHPGATSAGPPPNGGEGGADDPTDEKPRSRLRKATCACGFIIRVSMKTYLDTTIRCESCGEAFRLT